MSTTTEPTIVDFIPETTVVALEKRLKQINRRAEKLGVEPLRFELTGREELRKPLGAKPRTIVLGRHCVEFTERFVEVAVYGEQPKLTGGWKLLGVIDHREALPITKTMPGQEMPAGQRERGAICDHCGTARRRVDTFVLRNEDGEVVQIGRQCIADFLGKCGEDPAAQLNWYASSTTALLGDLDDGDAGPSEFGQRGRDLIRTEDVTLISAACIDEFGWVSKGMVWNSEDATATAARVAFLLGPCPSQGAARQAWVELHTIVEKRSTDELIAEAKAACEWAVAKVDADSDYLRNLAACAISKAVGYDKLGLVCSLIAAYRREQERLVKAAVKAKEVATSEHVGSVKDRLTLELRLQDKPRAFETAYGVSYRCDLVDQDGNLFVWWASNDPTDTDGLALTVGEPAKVKATVKKHTEFKGTKQTVVTRVARAK